MRLFPDYSIFEEKILSGDFHRLYTCKVCGSLLEDRDKHLAFHEVHKTWMQEFMVVRDHLKRVTDVLNDVNVVLQRIDPSTQSQTKSEWLLEKIAKDYGPIRDHSIFPRGESDVR